MSRVTRLLRVSVASIILLLLAVGPLQVTAATTLPLTVAETPELIITELQTNGGSAAYEFIELYNPLAEDVELSDWKLQFYTSTSIAAGTPDWTKPATSIALSGVLAAHEYFVVSSTDYRPGDFDADLSFSSRMADTGGGVQLAYAPTTEWTAHDRLMWKKPASGETLPSGVYQSPTTQGSLQRAPNEDDEYWKQDGSLMDFTAVETISAYDKWTAPVPVVDVPENPASETEETTAPDPETDGDIVADPAPETSVQPTAAGANEGLDAPQITELLPNPAAPLKDETDEFIELYNPNAEPFYLKGYILEVGLTTLRDYTISDDLVIPVNGYAVLYSKDTNLSLTNTGSRAKLLNPDNTIAAESEAFGTAPEGQVWMLENGKWQWSTTATPGALNILALPAVIAKSTKTTASKTTAAKTAAAKKAAAAKTAKAKAAAKPKAKKAAKAKTAKKKTAIVPIASVTEKPPRAPIHTGILVAVIGVAILYAAYEYRNDLFNQLRKLFGNRGTRQFARP